MKIKNITLELGKGKDKKEISLSVEEAKELSQQLNELFDNRKTEFIPIREYVPWWSRPYWKMLETNNYK